MLHEIAEKYVTLAVNKVAESAIVRSVLRLASLVACVLVVQVIILAYVAWKL